jgi:hypothetical protein
MLTISQFDPQPGESFTLRDLMVPIAMMPALRCLNIYNVNIDILGEPRMSFGSTDLSLKLRNMMDFSVITAMVDFLRPYALHLTDCSVVNGFDFPYEGVLHLNYTDEEDDLAPLLESWHGDVLEVGHCPTFTDDIIDLMCDQSNPGEFQYAPHMDTLTINSWNVSIDALKQLVVSRGAHEDTRLESLFIRTVDALDISEEDRAWFTARLVQFDYG